jgi:hypothetical protein
MAIEKYYTPEISEFHIGFEYESKNYNDDGYIKRILSFDKADMYYFGLYTYSDRMISFYEMNNPIKKKLDCFFRGEIKNKSELRKIMLILNIN